MSLFAELKRRNVFRVAAAYVIIGWLVMQIGEVMSPALRLPDWVLSTLAFFIILGFPFAMFFAWAFELTPEGLKREHEVDRSQSITHQTGRKLDFMIIAVLLLALGWFAWDKFVAPKGEVPVSEPASIAAMEDAGRIADSTPKNEKSVAVLPFIAISSGPDDEYFADGLTEEILNALAQLPELLVTARTSAFSFKGQDIPVQEIAAALGVRHIVEGSVRRSGKRLRVTAQLVRADDGFHLWSEKYDSTSEDTIGVQEDIAEKIATAMDVVLDEEKREVMRRAGLRDVEAFTIYQKGLEMYGRAHGDIEQIDGLRQANAYFEVVMERVPEYPQVYVDHSDLFVHILNNDVTGQPMPGVTEDDLADAYPAAIADMQAAVRYARTPQERHSSELDLAFLSGNWRGLTGRLALALADQGCVEGNWIASMANMFGYASQYYDRTVEKRSCDPRWTIAWFNAARAMFWTGDVAEALSIARQGTEIAPGGWLNLILIRSMIANGLYEEADREIENRLQLSQEVLSFKAMIAATRGDAQRFEELFEQYSADPGANGFWTAILYSWGGKRADVNRMAAEMDRHPFGAVSMVLLAYWCTCGAPWDLEDTPNFATKLEEGNLPWPPASPIEFPLKDW